MCSVSFAVPNDFIDNTPYHVCIRPLQYALETFRGFFLHFFFLKRSLECRLHFQGPHMAQPYPVYLRFLRRRISLAISKVTWYIP